jgi:tetratricopeptide (TPR) repeat protein
MRPHDLEFAKQEVLLHADLTRAAQGADTVRNIENSQQDLARMRDLISRFPQDKGLKTELAVDLAGLASALMLAGELDESAEAYRQSIEMREELLRGDPHNTGLQRGLIVANGNYARVLGVPWFQNLGRFSEARVAGQKAVAMARAMVAADPTDANARFDLSMSLSRLGSIEPEPEGVTASLSALQEAIALMEPVLKSNPKTMTIASQIAVACDSAGHRLESLGRMEEAAKQYQASLAAAVLLDGAGPRIIALQDLALLSVTLGDRAQAFDYAGRALAEAERHAAAQKVESSTAHWARSYFVLASVHAKFGERGDARRAAEKSLELWHQIHSPRLLALHQKTIDEAGEMAKAEN